MKGWVKVFVLSAVTLFIVSTSLFSPWFVIDQDGSFIDERTNIRSNFYLNRLDVDSEDVRISVDYTQKQIQDLDMVSVFRSTALLCLAGTGLVVLSLLAVIVSGTRGKKQYLAGLLAFLAMLLLVAAPVYLMMELPDTFPEEDGLINGPEDSFFGRDKIEGQSLLGNTSFEISWGGGTGWFGSIAGAFFALASMIAAFKHRPEPPAETAPKVRPLVEGGGEPRRRAPGPVRVRREMYRDMTGPRPRYRVKAIDDPLVQRQPPALTYHPENDPQNVKSLVDNDEFRKHIQEIKKGMKR